MPLIQWLDWLIAQIAPSAPAVVGNAAIGGEHEGSAIPVGVPLAVLSPTHNGSLVARETPRAMLVASERQP